MTSFEIPYGIVTVPKYFLYNCSAITSITIPNATLVYELRAFAYCSSLLSIDITKSFKISDDYIFQYCISLKKVTFPYWSFYIGYFKDCRSLSHLICKASSYQLYYSTSFEGCTKLKSFDVNYTFSSKNIGVFPVNRIIHDSPYKTGECGPNITYTYDFKTSKLTITGSGRMYNDYFSDLRYVLKYVNIEGNVTSIGNRMFYDFNLLISINLPDSLTSIGEHAFYKCTNLQTINIPGNVTSIGEYAFYGCKSLNSINLSFVTSFGSNAFQSCINLTSFDIPHGVGIIPDNFLYGCSAITSITIPDTVTTIGDYSFYNCFSLTAINIHNSVTIIGKSSFSLCTSLATVNLSESLETIEVRAFHYCELLSSISIPSKTINIENLAFESCHSLDHVLYKGYREPTIFNEVFKNCLSLQTIEVYEYYEGNTLSGIPVTKIEPIESIEKSGECDDNLVYKINTSYITIKGSGPMLDYNQSNSSPFTLNKEFIINAIIGDEVTSIGKYAFYNCTSLISINLSDSVSFIGDQSKYY